MTINKSQYIIICIMLVALIPVQSNALDFSAHEKKLEQHRIEYGVEHPSTLSLMYMLAELYKIHGKFDNSEQLYRQLISLSAEGGNRDYYPEMTLLMDNLANVYLRQGMYDDAELLYKQSMEQRKRLYGEGHPSLAYSNYYLGTLYSMQGKYEQAERLYLRNMEIKKRFDGSNAYIHWLVRNDIKQVLDNSAQNLNKIHALSQPNRPSSIISANNIN